MSDSITCLPGHTLTVAGLIATLEKLPLDAPVHYKDMNFGGVLEAFTPNDVELEGKVVLIKTPYWEPCE